MAYLYRVEFEKFRDPIKSMINDAKKRKLPIHAEPDEEAEENEFAEKPESFAVMNTEFGVLPLTEVGLGSTNLNLWDAHLNFPLEKKHIFIINTTLGVEAAQVKTPYRFIFGIGKLFDEMDVKNRLRANLVKSMQDNNFIASSKLRDSLSKQYKFFAIINMNGKNHVLHGNSKEEVETQIQNFTEKHGNHPMETSYNSPNSP